MALMAAVPSPDVRVTVAEYLIPDLGRVSEWCAVADLRFGGPDALTAVACWAPQSLPVGQQTRCRVFRGFISQLSGYIHIFLSSMVDNLTLMLQCSSYIQY